MRFYTQQHKYYCGIDLHTKKMHICILNDKRDILLHRNMPTNREQFLHIIAPYRENIAVAVECIFTWYWIADLCVENDIPFILGHALYMKAIHGGKAKNDKIDSSKIAVLLKGGMMPTAYVYPPKMREGIIEKFPDPVVRRMVETDLILIESYDKMLDQLDRDIVKTAKTHDPISYTLLKTIPGVGRILGLVLLYEIENIQRFPRDRNSSPTADWSSAPRNPMGNGMVPVAVRSVTHTSSGLSARWLSI